MLLRCVLSSASACKVILRPLTLTLTLRCITAHYPLYAVAESGHSNVKHQAMLKRNPTNRPAPSTDLVGQGSTNLGVAEA